MDVLGNIKANWPTLIAAVILTFVVLMLLGRR